MAKTERRGQGQAERANRLFDLIKARGISARRFHKEMHKRGVPGSSYPNITRYLNGELNPTPDLVIAAAEYLDVPITFLLEGKTERPVPKASVKLIAEQIEHDIARGFPGYELLAPSARWAPWQARQNIRAHKLMIGEEFEPRKLSRDLIENNMRPVSRGTIVVFVPSVSRSMRTGPCLTW